MPKELSPHGSSTVVPRDPDVLGRSARPAIVSPRGVGRDSAFRNGALPRTSGIGQQGATRVPSRRAGKSFKSRSWHSIRLRRRNGLRTSRFVIRFGWVRRGSTGFYWVQGFYGFEIWKRRVPTESFGGACLVSHALPRAKSSRRCSTANGPQLTRSPHAMRPKRARPPRNWGFAKRTGSYEALVADPDIDAIYIPLPNHLHVEWTTRAADAGKHVLCEKPIGLNAADAEHLLAVRDRTGVLIQEAFMVRTHPQWLGARDIARSGRIGEVRSIVGYFSFFMDDPTNIRHVKAWGGGGILDIGCYLVNTSRMIFGRRTAPGVRARRKQCRDGRRLPGVDDAGLRRPPCGRYLRYAARTRPVHHHRRNARTRGNRNPL